MNLAIIYYNEICSFGLERSFITLSSRRGWRCLLIRQGIITVCGQYLLVLGSCFFKTLSDKQKLAERKRKSQLGSQGVAAKQLRESAAKDREEERAKIAAIREQQQQGLLEHYWRTGFSATLSFGEYCSTYLLERFAHAADHV